MANPLARSAILLVVVLLVPACGSNQGDGGGSGGGGQPGPGSNQPPGVAISTPAQAATFGAGSSILIEASASDTDGFITRVDLFQGSTLLGTALGFPFRITWSNVPAGTYSLTAIATDNGGAETTSMPVSITVSSGGGTTNHPPAVSMILPSGGSAFLEGTAIPLEASASDPDGSVAKVEFLVGATLLATVFQPPWRSSWAGAASGTYSLRAVATDGSGASTSSDPVSVTVTPSTTPSGWFALNSGTSINLSGVFFIDASVGWVVGWSGLILHTTDGGASWTAQASGTTSGLTRVQFVSATRGWAVGALGVILSTSDGGATWIQQSSGTTEHLRGLSFVNATSGWAAGGDSLLKTTDGGSTWVDIGVPLSNYGVVSFQDPLHGWVGWSGVAAYTSDGGATWTRYTLDPGEGDYIAYLGDSRFMSPTIGTMVGATKGQALIVTTTDGGGTWKYTKAGTVGDALYGVTFGDAQHLWAVGNVGRIMASSDQGLTWVSQVSSTHFHLEGVWFVDGNRGWAVGHSGTILKTTTGGHRS